VTCEASNQLQGCVEVSAADQIDAALAVYSCWQQIRDTCTGDKVACVEEACPDEYGACAP